MTRRDTEHFCSLARPQIAIDDILKDFWRLISFTVNIPAACIGIENASSGKVSRCLVEQL
ncbi:hypothetical protein [Leclercia sp.]|uniref:hypothetical protein n=1 Tax=Leclercia sp. TaxID=1898428 RepID=UPI002FDDD221